MQIEYIISSLERTIEGKEKMLEILHPNNPYTTEFMSEVERAVHLSTIAFLKLNIIELRTILNDARLLQKQLTFNPGVYRIKT